MSIIRATVWSNMGEAVQFRNVFTYNCPDHTYNTTVGAAIVDRHSGMWGAILGLLSTVWAYEGIHFEELVEGVWQPRGEIAGSLSGTSTAEILPFMNAGLILAYTGVAKTIGKKFIGGITEAFNVDGALVTTAVTSLTSFLGYWLGVIDVGGNGVWTPGTVTKLGTFHAFISGVVNDLFATQRRRHPGVGI